MKGIIFDCDGVLVDSEVIYLESLVNYLKSLNRSTEIEHVQYVVGKKAEEISRNLMEQFDLQGYTIEEIVAGQRECFTRYWEKYEVKPMKGLVEFLKRCKAHGLTLAIASSSRSAYIEDLLERLQISAYFDYIVSGEVVEKGKPAPDIFLYTLERMGLDKKDVVIIEDSVNGIQAGKASGIYTIGFKGSKIIQDTSQADFEVFSFEEIEFHT